MNEHDLSEHAHVERQAEHIAVKEVEEAIFTGQALEVYKNDPRGESILIGARLKYRSLHVVCGKRNDRILVVTVYEPKPPKWVDFKTRSRLLKDRK